MLRFLPSRLTVWSSAFRRSGPPEGGTPNSTFAENSVFHSALTASPEPGRGSSPRCPRRVPAAQSAEYSDTRQRPVSPLNGARSPRRGDPAQVRFLGRAPYVPAVLLAAFTLIELLAVIAIIGVIAAVVAPTLNNFRKSDAMLASTRQMLGAVARGRQLAISQHTTVYMVFVPTNFWKEPWLSAPATLPQRIAATNLVDKQLAGYTYIALRAVGDQPGRGVPRYLSAWQTLPESTFIPLWKFDSSLPILITNLLNSSGSQEEVYSVNRFTYASFFPFPTENAPANLARLPYIAFNYLGQLTPGDGSLLDRDEYIPLAHGSVSPAINTVTRAPQFGDPSVMEKPDGNSLNTFNLIHIDRFTGRARLERQEIR
jgi:prepilin-type N-terminal cleavage/methylation domain-containing protein